MLAVDLNTNEVKNSAGTAVPFTQVRKKPSGVTYEQTGGNPSLMQVIEVDHEIIGSGSKLVRNSRVQIKYPILGNDGITKVTVVANLKLSVPVGQINDLAAPKNVLAYMGQLLANKAGAGTTVVLDGTSTLAVPLAAGSL